MAEQYNKKVPQIRFKGFEGKWNTMALGELGKIATNKRIFIHQTSSTGDVPFYKIGTFGKKPKLFISQRLFETYKERFPYPLKGDLLISVIGSIGRVVEYRGENEYFQDSNIVWLQHNGAIVNTFLKQFYSFVKWSGIEGSTIKHLYNKNILETQIQLPSQKEQTQIGSYFAELDRMIGLHQQKHKKLVSLKKAMLKKMFPQNGATTPEIRFKGFSKPWEEKMLGELVPLRGGFAFQSSHFSAKGVPIVKISNILSSGEVGGDFDYYEEQSHDENYLLTNNSAILAMSGATTGKVSILRNLEGQKVYQNQRVGYFEDIKVVDYTFISTVVRSELFSRQLNSVLVAGAQPNVSSKEINGFEFWIPQEKDEQKKIGTYFRQLDELIAQHSTQLDKLKQLKSACLEKMFV